MTQYMTEQRKTLISFLEKHPDKHFSAKEITAALDRTDISTSAVYRNLAFLEKNGYVSRGIRNGSREVVYQYVRCENCKDRLHLTCTKCGKTIHMNAPAAANMIQAVLTDDGFEISRAKTVLYGTCKECK